MKRNQPKGKSNTEKKKSINPQNKNIIKFKPKLKGNWENTTSTFGSRNSMQSRLLKNKQIIQLQSNSNKGLKTHNVQKSDSLTPKEQRTLRTNTNAVFSLPLKQNQQYQIQDEGFISYREYCIVGGQWVPLLTNTQRERITNPFKQFNHTKINAQQVCLKKNEEFIKQDSIQGTLKSLKEQLQKVEEFNEMSEEKKRYYYEILKQAINKLSVCTEIGVNSQEERVDIHSFLKKKVTAENQQEFQINHQINLQANPPQRSQEKSKQLNEISPVKQYSNEEINQQQSISLQNLIKLRQMKQLCVIDVIDEQMRLHTHKQPDNTIDTSISTVFYYVQKLLQVIHKDVIVQQIVNNLKLAWGHPKKQKLSRIRQNKSLISSNEVMPDYLFELIEDQYSENNFFSFIHNKCIFDFVNNQLRKLKPFYESDGQVFAWNFRLNSPLTFFQIQQSTIHIAVGQIKNKMIENCGFLCGLIVECETQKMQEMSSLLWRRRYERENMMLKKQLQIDEQKRQFDNQIQSETTSLLINTADIVFMQLICQWAEEWPL